MAAIVSPDKIAKVMGLRRRVGSIAELEAAVRAGLPKSALKKSVEHVTRDAAERTAMLYRIVPEATYKRRRETLKPEESERTERLARVIATAEYVWDDQEEARRFLNTPHPLLRERRPVDVALTELGARQIEELLWKLFHGLAA